MYGSPSTANAIRHTVSRDRMASISERSVMRRSCRLMSGLYTRWIEGRIEETPCTD